VTGMPFKPGRQTRCDFTSSAAGRPSASQFARAGGRHERNVDKRGGRPTPPRQPAATARDGEREGDVIEEAGGQVVGSVSALKEAISTAGTRPLLFLVRRGDQSLYLTISPRRAE
jgi:hypothetical protein